MRLTSAARLCLLLLAGCSTADADDEDDDGGGPTDQHGSDSGQAGADSGDSGGERTATLVRLGSATAGPSGLQGTEETTYTDEDGEVLCVFTATLNHVAVRSDCSDCDWAHDVVLSDATVVTEQEDTCGEILGGNVAILDGTGRGMGYQSAYLGHAEVLMVETDSGWAPRGDAEWDEISEAFTYEWEGDSIPY